MSKVHHTMGRVASALAALALGASALSLAATPAAAQPMAARPSETLNLSVGTGTLVRLSAPMSDLFIANDAIADVQVRSNNQLYVFGKGRGETTVYATDKSGRVVYAANVRVGNNISSLDEMLRAAMPEAQIQATPMNNLLLLTGTVASPEDAAEAQRLVQAYVGDGTQVVSRVRSAVPLQVNLKVRIAEVNRSALKQVGVNLLSFDRTSGFQFGIGQGDPGTNNASGKNFRVGSIGTTIAAGGKLFGLDLLGTLDLLASDGLAATLAEPNLTALSGETASFLAGGEFPIPISQGVGGAISVEYKQYGVGLAFTPVVLADGRISMRVRPEVSELSTEGALRLNGYDVPAITTRRAETTVELGSGQSFMLAGLLRTNSRTTIEKAPFLGDLPILGTLFRSNNYRRAETELVIIVTPYLVRPTNGPLPTPVDGYRIVRDGTLTWEGQSYNGVSGPRPVAVQPAPGVSVGAAGAPAAAASPPAALPAPGFKL
ncbi:type II and III secretion system protein family protein [Sphingomonas sp. LHG3406-1]|uniref:type II and III secretion system protein family protein n=1 Tax=Sphingomonas sp. LHG3406-1 TaxID=2804617 RepID=UPI002629907A|nr:type II and III secretion system protein family protein [Sphingomonas sp. LHG3406-1]